MVKTVLRFWNRFLRFLSATDFNERNGAITCFCRSAYTMPEKRAPLTLGVQSEFF